MRRPSSVSALAARSGVGSRARSRILIRCIQAPKLAEVISRNHAASADCNVAARTAAASVCAFEKEMPWNASEYTKSLSAISTTGRGLIDRSSLTNTNGARKFAALRGHVALSASNVGNRDGSENSAVLLPLSAFQASLFRNKRP